MSLRLSHSLARAVRAPSSHFLLRGPAVHRHSYSTSSHTCPQCSAPLPTVLPVCPACKFIAPLPSSTSPRDILAQRLEPGANPFKIDTKSLRAAFLQAQRVCHPDSWSAAAPKAQQLAVEYSARVNEAYKALSSPRRRAEMILEAHGRISGEEEQLEDQELFLRVMDAREQIEEGDDEVRMRIASENRDEMDASITRLDELIGREDWDAAKAEAIKLRYLETIDAAARGMEHH